MTPASHNNTSRDGAVEPSMMPNTHAAMPCPRAELSGLLFEHDLFRKPVPTFRDHAQQLARLRAPLRAATWVGVASFQGMEPTRAARPKAAQRGHGPRCGQIRLAPVLVGGRQPPKFFQRQRPTRTPPWKAGRTMPVRKPTPR